MCAEAGSFVLRQACQSRGGSVSPEAGLCHKIGMLVLRRALQS